MTLPLIDIRPLPGQVRWFSWPVLVATFFHSGRLKPVSGTWGTLASIPLCFVLKYFFGWPALVALAVFCLSIGIIAIKRYLLVSDRADPSEIVIDEVLGMTIVAIIIPDTIAAWIIAFFVFRLCDGLKRGPVGWCDKNIKGAWGVMIDDAVAGLMAGLIVFALFHFPAV